MWLRWVSIVSVRARSKGARALVVQGQCAIEPVGRYVVVLGEQPAAAGHRSAGKPPVWSA
jgi:hypothetical protein